MTPNATHLLQQLDVAFFGPFKKAWQNILTEWKGKNKDCVQKSEFPALLKRAVNSVSNTEQTIKSGFQTCGIVPINADVALKKKYHRVIL